MFCQPLVSVVLWISSCSFQESDPQSVRYSAFAVSHRFSSLCVMVISQDIIRTQKGFPLRAVAKTYTSWNFSFGNFSFRNHVFQLQITSYEFFQARICSVCGQNRKNGFAILGPQFLFYFTSYSVLERNKRKKDSFAIGWLREDIAIEQLREDVQALCGSDQILQIITVFFQTLRNTLSWTVVDTRVIFPSLIIKRRPRDWGQRSRRLVCSLTWFFTNCTISDNVVSFGVFLFI